LSPLRREVRRTSTDYERPLGPAKLYLDDLDDLVAELRKVVEVRRERTLESLKASDSLSEELNQSMQKVREAEESLYRVYIGVRGAEADEVDDLRSASPKDLRVVSIYSLNPRIRVYLTPSHATASVTAKADEASLRALIDDIVEFVKRRRVFLIWRTGYMYFGAFLLAWVGLQSWAYLVDESRPKTERYLLATAYGAMALVTIVLLPIMSRRQGGVVIVPERRGESRGLTAQTRRDLMVAVVGAVVGFILTAIGAALIR
jgi:hypothetical protein